MSVKVPKTIKLEEEVYQELLNIRFVSQKSNLNDTFRLLIEHYNNTQTLENTTLIQKAIADMVMITTKADMDRINNLLKDLMLQNALMTNIMLTSLEVEKAELDTAKANTQKSMEALYRIKRDIIKNIIDDD